MKTNKVSYEDDPDYTPWLKQPPCAPEHSARGIVARWQKLSDPGCDCARLVESKEFGRRIDFFQGEEPLTWSQLAEILDLAAGIAHAYARMTESGGQ